MATALEARKGKTIVDSLSSGSFAKILQQLHKDNEEADRDVTAKVMAELEASGRGNEFAVRTA